MKRFATTLVINLLLPLLALPSTATALSFGPDQESQGIRLDQIVAIVEDDVITQVELEEAVETAKRRIRQSETALPPDDILQGQVLERLILAKLQLRAAERNGIVIDDQTLNAAIENLARQNNLSISQLRATLERDGFNFAQFREDMRKELMATRLRQRIVDSRIQISEQEVESMLSGAFASSPTTDGNVQYHVAQILIAVAEEASSEDIAAARDKALQVMEDLNQGADFGRLAVAVSDGRQALEGGDLGWRSADQLPTLFATVIPAMEPGEISDLVRSPSGFHIVKLLETRGSGPQQLITQTRARHILITPDETVSGEEAQQRLQRLRQRILEGEDFAELARAHSDDTASAVRGGELGWLSAGTVAPPFEEAMNRLAPGDISTPIQTPFGWHIVQVLERRQREGTQELQRAQVQEALFRRRVEEEWELWLRRLRDEAYVEIRL